MKPARRRAGGGGGHGAGPAVAGSRASEPGSRGRARRQGGGEVAGDGEEVVDGAGPEAGGDQQVTVPAAMRNYY